MKVGNIHHIEKPEELLQCIVGLYKKARELTVLHSQVNR